MEFFLGSKATPAGVASRGLEPGLSAKGAPMRIPAIPSMDGAVRSG